MIEIKLKNSLITLYEKDNDEKILFSIENRYRETIEAYISKPEAQQIIDFLNAQFND